jgi:hypothetical protein
MTNYKKWRESSGSKHGVTVSYFFHSDCEKETCHENEDLKSSPFIPLLLSLFLPKFAHFYL